MNLRQYLLISRLHPLYVLVPLALAGCAPAAQEPAKPRPVKAVQVGLANLQEQSEFAGDVRPRHETRMAFRVGGKLASRAVELGSEVRAGDLLARLDDRDLALTREAHDAQLAAAKQEEKLARADMARYTELFEKNFISRAEFERRANAFESAIARSRQLQAQFTSASNQFEYAVLRADHAGVVTGIEAEPGQVLAAGQSVVRIARSGELEAAIAIPEHRVDEVRSARTIRVVSWANPELSVEGRLREVSPSADPVTRTYAARIALPAASASFRLGMTVRVMVLPGESGKPTLVRVPLDAVMREGDQASLWLVDPQSGSVTRRPVTLAAFRGNEVEIAKGIERGQWVVSAGAHLLQPGQRVSIRGSGA